MSVHLPAAQESYEDYLKSIGRESDGIAELLVADIRKIGCDVKHRPEPADQKHYEVTPYPPQSKKAKKNGLCKIARLVREPSPPTQRL